MAKPNLRLIAVLLLCCVALAFRVRGLGEVGLSEDEANKILAVESYRQGNFSPNSEHPMLMKMLCAGSVILAEKANAILGTRISPEAALRFPLGLTGAVTTGALYVLGVELLNPPAALMAAALWATDINAIALTRIAKEDPLVTLFFILGSIFLLRGKRLHFEDKQQAIRNYILAGASFGLLFASKYLVPILWLPLIYYDIFRFRKEPRWRMDRSTWFKVLGAFAVAFVVCNPVLFSPATWSYGWEHFTHKRLTHTGYFMLDTIYINKAYYTFWGMPSYFYPLYLLVKTPWTALVLFFAGLVYALRRFRDDRFLFLGMYFVLWLFLLTLPGGKFTRYMITLLPAVVLLQAVGMDLVCGMIGSHYQKRMAGKAPAWVALVALLLLTAGWNVYLNLRYHPFQSLYVASQGGGTRKWGYYFPQDDFYDAGLREAIGEISRIAPHGAAVLGTTPAAFAYYSARFGRLDLQFFSTADPLLPLNVNVKPYILFQGYRSYLENSYLLVFFRSQLQPLFISYVEGLSSVIVYRLDEGPTFAKAPFWTARHWPGLLAPLSGHKEGKL